MTHSCVWHDSFMCVTWLIHVCDMTHAMCDMTHSCAWHDSVKCVTWLSHVCDMTHSYVWHDSFICVTWLIHVCDMTHSYSWHDSFICVTWLFHVCDMTHSCVWHDSFICVTPQAEEIGLKIITTAKISKSCHGSPRSFLGSPQSCNFGDSRENIRSFHGTKRESPDYTRKPCNLEILMLEVWSPPWALTLIQQFTTGQSEKTLQGGENS